MKQKNMFKILTILVVVFLSNLGFSNNRKKPNLTKKIVECKDDLEKNNATVFAGDIVINEIFFDVNGAAVTDTNGDGNVNTIQDEFIEFVNNGATAVNMADYTIEDSTNTTRFTFPSPTTVPAGGSVVVFGGGTPTNIPGIALTTTVAGRLSLANGGDTVTLKDNLGAVVATQTYVAGDGVDQSTSRSPDGTGAFTPHRDITTNPVRYSPGRNNTTHLPFTPNTWTGATDSDWANDGNWSTGVAPIATDDILIPSALTRYPTSSTAITVNTVTLSSGASLIANDAFTGKIVYKRNIDFVAGDLNGWFLASSPIIGQDYGDEFVTNNDIATKGTNRGIAIYNTTDDTYTYLQDGGTGTFNAGQGYSIKKGTLSGRVLFTGTINTTNVPVTLNNSGNRFNLLGNPYTSAISSAVFLNDEAAISDTKTMYVWNQSATDFEVKTAGENFILAPTQGFIVKADTGETDFNFLQTNQLANTTDTFQKSSKTKIKLIVSDDSKENYANIYYTDNATKGFDLGYEGETFSGQSSPLRVFTELLEENFGKRYQVQSLPNNDFENMIIPIGIKADAGKEITLKAEIENLPAGFKLYIEDRNKSSYTRIDEVNTSFKITLNESINDSGRFYLHTASKALSTTTDILNSIAIYKTNNTTLKITGLLQQGKSNLKIFNILGKQLINASLNSNSIQHISLPKLPIGIYVVQLETEKGILNKKITLE